MYQKGAPLITNFLTEFSTLTNSTWTVQMVKKVIFNHLHHLYRVRDHWNIQCYDQKFVIIDAPFRYILRPAVNRAPGPQSNTWHIFLLIPVVSLVCVFFVNGSTWNSSARVTHFSVRELHTPSGFHTTSWGWTAPVWFKLVLWENGTMLHCLSHRRCHHDSPAVASLMSTTYSRWRDLSLYLTLAYICQVCVLSVFLKARYEVFSALTLLVEHQEEHPARKNSEWWGAGVVVCLDRGANDLHMVQLMPLSPNHLLLH